MKLTFSFELNFGKTNYTRGTKCEAMFPVVLWNQLKDGDYIISRRGGALKKIKKAKNGFIRMESGGFYVPCDRHFFAPVIEL